ncbi:MAG TPA: polysaccharide biosynthesis protein [Bacteroidales bacterium]|nr:polysaccharide biosynthesis protein [Bacteroidales bacterium]
MHYIKKLAGQTALYGLSSVVPRLLNYLLVPFHTRVFNQPEYGIITEMYAYMALLLILLTYGMETGFFRFSSKEQNSNKTYSTAFYSLLTTSTFFVVLMYFLSAPISSKLGYSSNPEYIFYLAAIIGLDAFSAIPFAKLRLMNRALTFSAIKIVGVIINVFLNIFFIVICPANPTLSNLFISSSGSLIQYVFISNLISSAAVIIFLLFTSDILPTTFSFARLKELLIYSFPLLVSGLGGTTNESFDRIFLKHLISTDKDPLYELGIYGANVKLAVLMVLFIQMYRYAVEPFFFANEGQKDSKKMYSNLLKYFVVFTLLIFMSVGLFTDIFQHLVGKEFREGLGVVPILLLANLFYGIFFNISIWYKLVNKTWYGVFYTFSGAILTLILYFTLIPVIGYYGAAVARLACYIFMTVLCIVGGQKHYPIPYDFKRILLYLLAAIGLFLLGYFFSYPSKLVLYSFRVLLIFTFLLFVFFIEKISFKQILQFIKHEN